MLHHLFRSHEFRHDLVLVLSSAEGESAAHAVHGADLLFEVLEGLVLFEVDPSEKKRLLTINDYCK